MINTFRSAYHQHLCRVFTFAQHAKFKYGAYFMFIPYLLLLPLIPINLLLFICFFDNDKVLGMLIFQTPIAAIIALFLSDFRFAKRWLDHRYGGQVVIKKNFLSQLRYYLLAIFVLVHPFLILLLKLFIKVFFHFEWV